MSFFKKILSKSSVYAIGICATAFVLDRTVEIAATRFWAYKNKGVSSNLNYQKQIIKYHSIIQLTNEICFLLTFFLIWVCAQSTCS